MKILILGSVGSGKTTLGKKIASKLKIPFISSDDIIFNKHWKKRRDSGIKKKLEFFNTNNSWVFEGVASKRLIEEIGVDFDVFILLDYSKRIIFKRNFGRFLEERKKKSTYGKLRSLFNLIFWVLIYSHDKDLEFARSLNDDVRVFVLKNDRDNEMLFEKLK